MTSAGTDIDPYLHDPLRWGASMAHHQELLRACLDAVGARSIVEVGAYAGDLTRVLAAWAAGTGARVQAVDPAPQPGLVELAERHPGVELVRETSLDALPEIELPDVAIIDGDHNYYTVSEELRILGERAPGDRLPLLLFHDVCWPHGRRDDYFDAEAIPAEYRHPQVGEGRGIVPGEPGARRGGLPYPRSAEREGGARNGVLTAVEDFVAAGDGLRLVVVPAFFGFGAVWHSGTRWAGEIERLLDPWNRHPLLARLESNRVHHIAREHATQTALWDAEQRAGQQSAVLARLTRSSAFALAERLSALRVRMGIAPGDAMVSRSEIQRLVDQPPG